MPSSISLLVAYPKELIRAGLRAMLEKSRIKVVSEAEDAADTLTLAKKHKPDVVLMDAAIPGSDAFELVTKLAKILPATRCVLLTARDNPTYMARAHAIGAANCLLESVTRKELVSTIEIAAAGRPALGSAPFARIVAAMKPKDATAVTRDSHLTPRESQVLSHIALGLSNDEIAQSMKISTETVKEHVANLLRKLSVRDRTQAAVWAVRAGVV